MRVEIQNRRNQTHMYVLGKLPPQVMADNIKNNTLKNVFDPSNHINGYYYLFNFTSGNVTVADWYLDTRKDMLTLYVFTNLTLTLDQTPKSLTTLFALQISP